MIEFIQSILGTYTPVTYEVYNAATETYDQIIGNGFSGVDWPYVVGAAAFLIMLWSVFRIIGIFVDKL